MAFLLRVGQFLLYAGLFVALLLIVYYTLKFLGKILIDFIKSETKDFGQSIKNVISKKK